MNGLMIMALLRAIKGNEILRIFHITALPIWSMDGKGGMPSLQETLRGHKRAGHDIFIIMPRYDLFSDSLTDLSAYQQGEYDVRFARCAWFPLLAKLRALARRVSGGESVPYPARWGLNMAMLLLLTVSFVFKALKLYKGSAKPDLVYAHNQYAALSGFLLGCLWRIPNVTRLYGTFLANLIDKPLVTLRYPTAAAGFRIPSSLLICGNDGTQGDVIAGKFGISMERFRFWQNGVEPPSQTPRVGRDEFASRFGSGIRTTSKWVISCSRLSYWKRIDRILQAVAVSRENGIDCQLLLAGDGPEKGRLTQLANDLGIAKEVIWLGAVAHDDIWALMNLADVFMITNDVTNRCNPLYEAAWAGLPVVSVFDRSTSDLLHHEHNALLAEKDDTQTLGQHLTRILRDETLAHDLGQAQKRLAATFWTWEERMQVEVKELEKIVFKSSDSQVR